MSRKPHASESALIFAWGARDHSLWHLILALIVLMAAMAGFFFIFRIVHPVVQRQPVTPQHVISLDPKNPAELALIHRAQDRRRLRPPGGEPAAGLSTVLCWS
jgi:hypothetical protein